MKKSLGGFDVVIEIGDWTPKLRITAIIFSVMTMLSAGITLFFRYTVPGLTPILFGIVMLLLGVREFNSYFKIKKSMITITLGIICTLIFILNLCIGINQVVTAFMKLVVFTNS